jgi:hypothetical protein
MHTELNLKKIAFIKRLLEAGHGEELRLILFGASRFNCPELDDDPDVIYPPAWVHYEGRLHLISLVQAHLEFTAMFGASSQSASEGRRHYFAHIAEFELWLNHGAPGVSIAQLQALEAAYNA